MSSEPLVYTKRALVTISHAIEEFALAGSDGPMAVIALFQRLSYFHREVDMYRRLAKVASVVLVGVAEEFPPALPDGVGHVLLRPDEEMAREWSIAVLCPRAGAMLRCTDLETLEPHAPTLEAGRRFFGRWSMRREDAYGEVVRMRTALRGRIGDEQSAALDDVLERVLREPGDGSDARTDAALQLITGRTEALLRRHDRLTHDLDVTLRRDRDPRTGLRTAAFVDRFTAGSAPGTLPVAVLMLRLPGLAGLRRELGPRAELATLQTVARILNGPLADVDHAARLDDEHFLLLMPQRREMEARAVQEALARAFGDLGRGFPFVTLPMASVLVTTRTRPLPLPEMRRALAAPGPAHTVIAAA